MVYPIYETRALRWQQLTPVPDVRGYASSASSLAKESFKQALQTKSWLLEPDQHLIMPKTHLDEYGGRIFSMGDFVKRADEARALDVQRCAVDDQGQHRALSQDQLDQLKQTGELDVPSQLFENQHHTWRVAPFFFSGRQKLCHSLCDGVGRTLDHAVVFTGDSVIKRDPKFPTLRNAIVNGLGKAVEMLQRSLGQLFVGRLKHRAYSDANIDALMDEAEKGYVQYYLREEGFDTRRLYDCATVYSDEVLDKLWEALEEDGSFGCEYRRTGGEIRAEQEANHKISALKRTFEERMRVRRNVALKVDQAKALKSPRAAKDEMEHATREWQDTKDKAWIEHLQNSTEDDVKQLGQFEVERLLALQIELQVKQEDEEQIDEKLKEYEDSLRKKRPLLSLSGAWRERKLDAKRLKMRALLESDRLERVARRLKEKGLEAQYAARRSSAEFRRDIRDEMADRLRRKKCSFPSAQFDVLQLNPNKWTCTTNSRYKTVEVDLGKPFWRARYTWLMMVSITKSLIGGAYHFLTAGPLSLRAFFSPRPYYAVTRPTIDHDSLTQTLASRLRSFFDTLAAVRQCFESASDTGLIGKSIQRHFLRIYLGIKGILGTFSIFSFMTIGTLLATLFSAAVLALAPVLAVLVTTASSLFNLMLYDTAIAAARSRFHQKNCFGESQPEMPSSVSPILKIAFGVPYFLIFPGGLQAISAVIRLGIIHPVVAVGTLSWASLRFMLRSLRDSITWPILRKYSRIPGSDSFLAWRIHGPGVAPTQYYRLPIDAAKAAVLLLLDKYRLRAHSEVRTVELNAPYDCYRELFDKAVWPFGLGIIMRVNGPSSIGSLIATEVRREREHTQDRRYPEPRTGLPKAPEHPLDIWDVVGQGIRSSHPDAERLQTISSMRTWYDIAAHSESMTAIDNSIRSRVDEKYSKCKSKGGTELDAMVNRAAKILAEWNLKLDVRERRLNQAMAIPLDAEGKFRMSEAETTELWKFTLEAVELYGHQLKQELLEILESSEFSNKLQATVMQVSDSFYTRSGARPGQDIPIVASFLLRQLLGDDMMGTLEEIDEELVLSPKMSKEDEHLVFWSSFHTAI